MGADAYEWEPKPPCVGLDDLFFSAVPAEIDIAKAICRGGCPHGVACAEVALEAIADGLTDGVWAGMTLEELKQGLADADRSRARTAGHPSAAAHGDVVPGMCDEPDDAGRDVRAVPQGADPAPGA